jgi:hypothetical protein
MDSMSYNSFNTMFGFVSIIIMIGAISIFVLIILTFIRQAKQSRKNSQSPVLTVDATIITKRIEDTEPKHFAEADDTYSRPSLSAWYYTTFQVDSGDRMELLIPSNEFGLLTEGDKGKLTFQGTKYLSFIRQ